MLSLKLKYFYSHLAISALVVISIGFTCQFLWFPTPFIFIDGTWVALFILAIVDITLGPLLTLLLINARKSKQALLVDMLIIVSLQLTALTYGLIQIEKEQVLAIVHYDGAFNLIPKKELKANELSVIEKLPEYHGIRYAMIVDADLFQHSKNSTEQLLYSAMMYRRLTKKEILKAVYPYKNLPKKIKDKYNSSYIFKGLAGKKQDAVLVLTENMKLVDIMLLPQE